MIHCCFPCTLHSLHQHTTPETTPPHRRKVTIEKAAAVQQKEQRQSLGETFIDTACARGLVCTGCVCVHVCTSVCVCALVCVCVCVCMCVCTHTHYCVCAHVFTRVSVCVCPSVCVWVLWDPQQQAVRQCEVEVNAGRRRSRATRGPPHASRLCAAPEDLLTLMDFDSCHLWVSSRYCDMDRMCV